MNSRDHCVGTSFNARHNYDAGIHKFHFLCHNPHCEFGDSPVQFLPCNVVDEAWYAEPPNIVASNPRVLCSGGAGTGKTMLALELAKRWTTAGKNVALACYSPWLKGFLEGQGMPGLTVTLAKHIRVTAKRAGIDKFDALIVDEGQDLLDIDTLGSLDNYIRNELGAANGVILTNICSPSVQHCV